jgi:CheY-like chemotaxis protein
MKRIALSFKMGESVDVVGVSAVKTDPVRLGQVVTNLLSNGIRFTSNSDVRRIELRFDLSFEPPDDMSCQMPRLPRKPLHVTEDMPIYLYVAVTDTGPGLTPSELEMLFQRFSQVSPKTHTVFGGSGLGLFVCRKITELMGGRIEVVSEYGKGSTFRFFIQARTCNPQKRSITPIANPAPAKKARKGITGPKPHVLIVEDNLINQTVLARQLRHVGLTCAGEVFYNEAENKSHRTVLKLYKRSKLLLRLWNQQMVSHLIVYSWIWKCQSWMVLQP